MLADVAAFDSALMAVWFGRDRRRRAKLLFITSGNSRRTDQCVGLVLISFFIFYEAYQRWFSRPVIRSVPMTIVAGGGLAVNLICALLLHRDRENDLNVPALAAFIGDALDLPEQSWRAS